MPGATAELIWNGDKIIKQMIRAEKRGLGFVRARAVRQAKKSHPGWKSRTGRAHRSIRSLGKIEREGKNLVAKWGSNLFYVLFLEVNHGSFMRAAGDAVYPMLGRKIKGFFENP
ncbi:hypothetical protein MYX75_01035 [Acidobacteria bacterium AH-259-A15]|nr:hypothetical protein [Acidobacteria bacterium AH-259-A15]